jgi:hypothetical protein
VWDGKTEAEVVEITRTLFEDHLNRYYSSEFGICECLEDHEINGITFHTVRSDNVAVLTVSYSVKPTNIEKSPFLAGNGRITADGWIIKSNCVYIVKVDGLYKIDHMG